MNILMLQDLIYRINNLHVSEEEAEEINNITDIIADIVKDLEERVDEENK